MIPPNVADMAAAIVVWNAMVHCAGMSPLEATLFFDPTGGGEGIIPRQLQDPKQL